MPEINSWRARHRVDGAVQSEKGGDSAMRSASESPRGFCF